MDPDQTAFRSSLIWVHNVCLYAKIGLKSLQEYSADDINRRHFQMQVLLGVLRVKNTIQKLADDILKLFLCIFQRTYGLIFYVNRLAGDSNEMVTILIAEKIIKKYNVVCYYFE